jgi:hypothetical protein
MALIERKNVPLIIELLDSHKLPITWATVGHLFLESCENKMHGRLHSDMPRPQRNRRWQGDWYQHDPGANVFTRPAWYCPDLIRDIQLAQVSHEIGSHSFSHIEFSSDCSNEELVAAEMKECLRVMRPAGIEPRTLVYPFNIMGHRYLELLSQFGIIAVRHRDSQLTLAYPERSPSGIYKIYETMGLRQSTWCSESVKAAIYLKEAVRLGLSYHLWFHPSDPTERFLGSFREILEHLVQLRSSGELWIATMRELSAYCEARRSTAIESHEEGRKLFLRFRSSYNRARYGPTNLTLVIKRSARFDHLKMIVAGVESIMKLQISNRNSGSDVLTLNVPFNTELLELSSDAR